MKYLSLAILALTLSTVASAKVQSLKCVATYNADKVLETEVKLDTTSTASLSFGEAEGFQFFLTNTKEGAVELQALNIYEPSRTYATAKLKEVGSYVELSIWNRAFIMEVRCTSI